MTMLGNGNSLAEQVNNYFSCNIELLLIIKSLVDMDCDIEGVLSLDAGLVTALKNAQVQDIARLKKADSRIPLFKLSCSGEHLTRAIESVVPNRPKAGSIDHVFSSGD
tara:strand:- start:8434 stop:8757 length:324 start_codon:yes stop_codon:yes gene_type:complete